MPADGVATNGKVALYVAKSEFGSLLATSTLVKQHWRCFIIASSSSSAFSTLSKTNGAVENKKKQDYEKSWPFCTATSLGLCSEATTYACGHNLLPQTGIRTGQRVFSASGASSCAQFAISVGDVCWKRAVSVHTACHDSHPFSRLSHVLPPA